MENTDMKISNTDMKRCTKVMVL